MLDILEVNPRINGKPTYPLQKAVEDLKQAAETAARNKERDARNKERGSRIRNRYLAQVLPDAIPPNTPPQAATFSVDDFKANIKERIKRSFGLNKGPSQSALGELDKMARRAEAAGYPLEDENVQEAFLGFLMTLVTEGFENQDTTGTQMGNYRGDWRGGGFFNY